MNARRFAAFLDWLHTPVGMVAGTVVMLALSWLPPSLAWINLPMAVLWPGHCGRVAVFGRRAPSSTPSLALAAIGSLTLWPLVGLAVAATGTRVTHATLALGIAIPCLAAAMWTHRRATQNREPSETEIISSGSVPRVRWIAIASIAAMLLGAWATVRLIPRPKPFEYSSIAFSGTWALARTAVAVQPAGETVVLATVRNDTEHQQAYRIAPTIATLDEHQIIGNWHAVTVTVKPHSQRQVELSGKFPVDNCFQQLRLTMSSDRGPRAVESDLGSNGSANANVVNDPDIAWAPITALVRLISDRCDRAEGSG